MTRSSPPGVSVTVSRMIAEPRMWPASSKTALTPGATSSSWPYSIGRKLARERSASRAV